MLGEALAGEWQMARSSGPWRVGGKHRIFAFPQRFSGLQCASRISKGGIYLTQLEFTS